MQVTTMTTKTGIHMLKKPLQTKALQIPEVLVGIHNSGLTLQGIGFSPGGLPDPTCERARAQDELPAIHNRSA